MNEFISVPSKNPYSLEYGLNFLPVNSTFLDLMNGIIDVLTTRSPSFVVSTCSETLSWFPLLVSVPVLVVVVTVVVCSWFVVTKALPVFCVLVDVTTVFAVDAVLDPVQVACHAPQRTGPKPVCWSYPAYSNWSLVWV